MFVRSYCKENNLTANIVCDFLTEKYNKKFTANNKLLPEQIRVLDEHFIQPSLPPSEPVKQPQLPQSSNLPVQSEQSDIDHTGERLDGQNGNGQRQGNFAVDQLTVKRMAIDTRLSNLQDLHNYEYENTVNMFNHQRQRMSDLYMGELVHELGIKQSNQSVQPLEFEDPLTPEFLAKLEAFGIEVPTTKS